MKPPHNESSFPAISRRRAVSFSAAALGLGALSACAPRVEPPKPQEKPLERRFRFALPSPIFTLDPALAADCESQRVIRQALQTLIGTNPATGAPVPLLAREYSFDSTGRKLTFELDPELKFHDGSAFNAEAVKANFESLYRLSPSLIAAAPGNAFRTLFGAHAGEKTPSLYEGCELLGEHRLTLRTRQPITALPQALTQVGFSILSPRQLASRASWTAAPSPQSFLPLGTGPFRLTKATTTSALLNRHQNARNTSTSATGIDFSVYTNEYHRLYALLNSKIDAFDLVTPDVATRLARAGKPVQTRDPFSLLYLGMNAEHPVLKKQEIRVLIARIINRGALSLGQFPNGTKTTSSFFPPRLGISGDNIPSLPSLGSPQEAKDALKAAGYRGEEMRFLYPLNAPQIYMPYPERTYAQLARQLQAAGLNIKPVPVDSDRDFLTAVISTENRAFHLTGVNGAYQDPSFFLNTFLNKAEREFKLKNEPLQVAADKVLRMPQGAESKEAYAAIDAKLSELAPAVPLLVPVSAVASSDSVSNLPVSPVLDEVYNQVHFS